MSDFAYVPSYRTDVTDEYKTLKVEFGDGYSQEGPDGINPVREVWALRFDNIPLATGQAIRAFFKARTGQSFTWTNPDGVEKRYKLRGNVTTPREGPAVVTLNCIIAEHFGV